ncbi:MAG: lysophospholipid acyltransferase family protein [Gemmatimonadota bacterium]
MSIRGTLTLAALAVALLCGDLVQRLVIAPLVWLIPSRRHVILGFWQQFIAAMVLWAVRVIGGARTGHIPQIPAGSGDLVLMNHQSLLDIPLVVRSLRPVYPRIVTRERYASGKPLISHMVRLYQYPTVNPRATGRADLKRLAETAASSPVPLVIYPEGTRTRDGSIGRFKRTGLRAILPARDWRVWVVAADGYWECAKLVDFRANVSKIRGTMRVDGPFAAPSSEAGTEAVDRFIDELESLMKGLLKDVRTEKLPSGAES